MSHFMEIPEGHQCLDAIDETKPFSSPFKSSKRFNRGPSLLGEPLRIRTPSKPVSTNSCNETNKENAMDSINVIRSPCSARKSCIRTSSIRFSAGNLQSTPNRKLSCGGNLIFEDQPRESTESGSNLLVEEDNVQRVWKVNDFSLGKPLGRGKFGNVYLAKQKATNVPVALKVLFKSQMNNEQIIKMLKREVEIQYRLKHPNINQLHSYFHDQKNVYLILEYAESGEFYKYLSKNRGLISEDRCKSYIRQIAAALDYMHQRSVYHRDIKPENILIGSKERLLLADFGSAVHAPAPLHSTRFTVCGTPEYLAPEMILGSGHDSSLDMWSVGILMYEIFYGRTPFATNQSDKHNGNDTSNQEELQDLQRQRMYERIITFKDELIFERRKERSLDNLLNENWKEPSPEAKDILTQLIKSSKTERLSARELLATTWLAELGE